MATQMFLLFACTLTVFISTFVGADDVVPPCEEVPVVYRNANLTCPPRAVCADVFDTVRNWYGYQGRSPCQEHRVLHNCMCPDAGGDSVSACPIGDDSKLLYSSKSHKQYICGSACNLPYCSNVRLSGSRGGRNRPAALAMVPDDPLFDERYYYRIDCRCPRHHSPSMARGVNRAVSPYRSQWNPRTGSFDYLYVCRSSGFERRMQDPCP